VETTGAIYQHQFQLLEFTLPHSDTLALLNIEITQCATHKEKFYEHSLNSSRTTANIMKSERLRVKSYVGGSWKREKHIKFRLENIIEKHCCLGDRA
jgi:hypothetical protein